MIVSGNAVARAGIARTAFRGMNRTAACRHAAYELVIEAYDDLALTGRIIAGHEGTDQSACGHAAQTVVVLRQQYLRAVTRRAYRRSDSRAAAANDQHFGLPYNRHIKSIAAHVIALTFR